MKLKIIGGALFLVVGLLFFVLGILFLIASMGESSRLIAGSIFTITGVASFITGIWLLKKGISMTPASVRSSLLKLGRIHNGEVSDDLIKGELGTSDDIDLQIQKLIKKGTLTKTKRNGRIIYIFEDYKMDIIVKECPFCGNDYPVRDDVEKCPSCGGDLSLNKNKAIKSGVRFSMDE